jgi:hypothetical protein
VIYLGWFHRPRREWWLLDTEGTLVWDYWTHRAARRACDVLNVSAVATGSRRRYRVERMP